MTTLADIELNAKAFSQARETLAERVGALNAAIAELRRAHLPGIKRTLQRTAQHQAVLQVSIESAPELFVKPRTLILHGIKLGFAKGKGNISFSDADQVCKLIRRHLADQADTLIKTTHKPIKATIAQLPAADIKRIGCTIGATGDLVVIAPVDSEVDKLVDALLAGAVDTATEQADAEAQAA